MVSPQSLSVATASAGLAGQEGMLFRRAIAHSVAQALLVAGLAALRGGNRKSLTSGDGRRIVSVEPPPPARSAA